MSQTPPGSPTKKRPTSPPPIQRKTRKQYIEGEKEKRKHINTLLRDIKKLKIKPARPEQGLVDIQDEIYPELIDLGSCAICSENIRKDACQLHCKHYFHCGCIQRWWYEGRGNYGECPLCRAPYIKVIRRSLPFGNSKKRKPKAKKQPTTRFRKTKGGSKRVSSTRKSPEQSATTCRVGTVKTGNDGNQWVVKKTSNSKRWVKI